MKKRYSIFLMSLGLALLLALPEAVEAQKTKSRTRSTRPSTARVTTRTQSSNSSARARRGRTATRSTTARVLRGRSIQSVAPRVLRGRSTQSGTPRNTVRINVAPRSGNRGTASRYTPVRTLKNGNGGVDREEYAARIRSRSGTDGGGVIGSRRESDRREHNRRARDWDGRGRGYDRGYDRGYRRGYHRGYHRGYRTGHYYQHYHYYGGHRLFGFHYGGFGFHAGRWHFVIVIHTPVIVAHRYHYYNYSWWDGRGQSLVTYDRLVDSYPANYNFDLSRASCVALWIRAVDGKDYVVEADPRYWDARNPGDLYASLWAELEQQGSLQIEDRYGAIHVFPAGLIQQIEVAPCR